MGKPIDWNKLNHKQKKGMAENLLFSLRGNYIISQALYYAIKSLKKVKKFPETSNIEDMEMLRETIFFLFPDEELIKKSMKSMEKKQK